MSSKKNHQLSPKPNSTEEAPTPTYSERLADFVQSYGKLITVDFEDLHSLVHELHAKVEAGDLAEHVEVLGAKAEIEILKAKIEGLSAIDESIREYAEIGLKAKLAEQQAIITNHADDNPIHNAMIEEIFFNLYDRGLLKFGKTAKKRSAKRNTTASFDSKALVAFSYQTSRTLKDGSSLVVPQTQGYLVGSENARVIEAGISIPADKLGIFNKDGMLLGKVALAQSKGSILGTAVAVVGGFGADIASQISGTGVSGLDQDKRDNALLLASIPTLKASIIRDGKNAELPTVGDKSITEKQTA
jgi:hypothetical protein